MSEQQPPSADSFWESFISATTELYERDIDYMRGMNMRQMVRDGGVLSETTLSTDGGKHTMVIHGVAEMTYVQQLIAVRKTEHRAAAKLKIV